MVAALAYFLPFSGAITVFGIPLTTAAGSLTLAGSLLNTVAGLALSAAFRPGAPTAPMPEDLQSNTKVAAGPRRFDAGLVKNGGNHLFHRAVDGTSYRVIAFGNTASTIERVELDRQTVTVDANGYVTDLFLRKGNPRVQVFVRRGVENDLTYPQINSLWPEWTPEHRIEGVTSALVISRSVSAEHQHATFPNGEPEIQIERRVGNPFDPRTGAAAYSDNAALVLNDYAASEVGLNDADFFDADAIASEAEAADELIDLPGGGKAPRWRLSGSWLSTQPRKDVLRNMLKSCGGRVRLQGNGKMALRLPRSVPPRVTLTEADIIGISDVTGGPGLLDRYNTASTIYTDRTLNFQSATCNEVSDADLVAEHGQPIRAEPVDAKFCPAHHQAQEVAKVAVQRDNPALEMTLECNCGGLEATGEFEIAIDAALYGLSGVWEPAGHSYHFDGGLLIGVSLKVRQLRDPSYRQMTANEQGEPPAIPVNSNQGEGVETPQNVQAVGLGVETSAGTYSAGISVSWDAPASDAVLPLLKYKAQSGQPVEYQPFAVSEGATSAQIGPLQNNGQYDIEISFIGTNGKRGPVVLRENVEALAAADAPNPPTDLAVAVLGNQAVEITLITSDTASNRWTRIYRDGVQIHEEATLPASPITFVDACGAGTFGWTARSVNVSNINSTSDAGPVNATIV